MCDIGIKIVLVSDSTLFLDGLRKILEYDNEIEIVAVTPDLKKLNTLIKDLSPALLFVDNRQFNCDIEKLLRMKRIRSNNIKVILFTEGKASSLDAPNLINVSQDTSASELIQIIKGANDEKTEIENVQSADFCNITKTELRIIKLVVDGDTNKEISEKLSITEKTVKAHISSIFEKLNVQNRYQLMLLGKRNEKNIEMNL